MTTITFEQQQYDCREDESVLACLTRHGLTLPSSCQSGVCQTCMMRATAGRVPERAQQGLQPTQRVQGFFLACVCHPTEDLTVERADTLKTYRGMVCGKTMLNGDVARIRITRPEGFDYHPGQFINVLRDEGRVVRSYSLASIDDEALELHVKAIPGGAMSEWLVHRLAVGSPLTFQGPIGNCFYLEGKPDQPMVMVGVSTGLAPLYGIVRDALARGHRGPIRVYHASLAASGLYYVEEMRRLAAAHDNLHYIPCVLHGPAPEGGEVGAVDAIVAATGDFSGTRVFLCGDPPIVNSLRQKVYLGGAHMLEIFSDPFDPAPSPTA
ncbi:MAG: oxygenase [Zetaproteobacteria bacterium]|nr:MAG: oxygenase [Zetaproteobacteria bacterium]